MSYPEAGLEGQMHRLVKGQFLAEGLCGTRGHVGQRHTPLRVRVQVVRDLVPALCIGTSKYK